jgi:Na+-driven multidrug efflux pump
MYVVGIALFVGAAMSGMGAAFTGAGMNRPLLWASLFGQWGVLVPWALVVGLLIEVPIVWLWVALLGGDVAELWFRRHLYMKTNWISHRV